MSVSANLDTKDIAKLRLTGLGNHGNFKEGISILEGAGLFVCDGLDVLDGRVLSLNRYKEVPIVSSSKNPSSAQQTNPINTSTLSTDISDDKDNKEMDFLQVNNNNVDVIETDENPVPSFVKEVSSKAEVKTNRNSNITAFVFGFLLFAKNIALTPFQEIINYWDNRGSFTKASFMFISPLVFSYIAVSQFNINISRQILSFVLLSALSFMSIGWVVLVFARICSSFKVSIKNLIADGHRLLDS